MAAITVRRLVLLGVLFPVVRYLDDFWADFRPTTRGSDDVVVACVQPGLPGPDNPRDLTQWGSYWDAMTGSPSWAPSESSWAPSVATNAAGDYVEFYATLDTQLGSHCIGHAVSTAPTGRFVDTSNAPFLCQPSLGGSIDPSVFTDASGQHYLLWKSDGNSIGLPSHIWSAPIDPNLDALTGNPVAVLTNDQAWQEGVVENPDMVEVNGSTPRPRTPPAWPTAPLRWDLASTIPTIRC